MELNIYEKLAKIRKIADVAKRDKEGYGYRYADLEQILAKVTTGMEKYGISLVPEMVPGTEHIEKIDIVKTKIHQKTKEPYEERRAEMLVSVQMLFRWVNNENPKEEIVIPWFVVGMQDDVSQAMGSALTYCTRYFLTEYFQIAQTDNDVDAYRSKQKAAELQEDKDLAEKIIKEFDEAAQKFVNTSKNKDKAKEELLALTSKYVKGGNYTKIQDPKLAAKLFEEFTNGLLNQSEAKKTKKEKEKEN